MPIGSTSMTLHLLHFCSSCAARVRSRCTAAAPRPPAKLTLHQQSITYIESRDWHWFCFIPVHEAVASDAVRTCRDPLAVGTHCGLRLEACMIWETLRTFTPAWILRASLVLLLQTWAFGKIHTLDSGRATSSRERRSAATPNQASTMAAIPIRAAPKK